MRQQYKVAKNPTDSKWYVIGNCGNGYWMPVSNPFTSKQDAERHISHQLKADSAAREESLEDHNIQGLGAYRDVFDAGGEQ
jgi:hypothetical protein